MTAAVSFQILHMLAVAIRPTVRRISTQTLQSLRTSKLKDGEKTVGDGATCFGL